jgi:hypothetical protein
MKKIFTGVCLTLALGFSFLTDVSNEDVAQGTITAAWAPGGDGGGGGD